MTSFDRMLKVLGLFSVERPLWTIDEAAAVLGGSRSTVYRYFRSLTDTGLLAMIAGRAYTLGPNIIELDRLMRLCDPLNKVLPAAIAAHPGSPRGSTVVHRLFRDRVVCVHVTSDDPDYRFVYSRGEAVPLFSESTSRVMLAHLPWRKLKDLYDAHQAEARATEIGASWDAFRSAMTAIRRAGHAETQHGEQLRLSAPIFDADEVILASVSRSVPFGSDAAARSAAIDGVKAVARHATASLARLESESLGGTAPALEVEAAQ